MLVPLLPCLSRWRSNDLPRFRRIGQLLPARERHSYWVSRWEANLYTEVCWAVRCYFCDLVGWCLSQWSLMGMVHSTARSDVQFSNTHQCCPEHGHAVVSRPETKIVNPVHRGALVDANYLMSGIRWTVTVLVLVRPVWVSHDYFCGHAVYVGRTTHPSWKGEGWLWSRFHRLGLCGKGLHGSGALCGVHVAGRPGRVSIIPECM